VTGRSEIKNRRAELAGGMRIAGPDAERSRASWTNMKIAYATIVACRHDGRGGGCEMGNSRTGAVWICLLRLHFVNHLHAALYLSRRDIAMNGVARGYIERATECVRLAEAENDDDMRVFLVNLASAWARAAAKEKAKSCQGDDRSRPRRTPPGVKPAAAAL
jgi:hypothetical protein